MIQEVGYVPSNRQHESSDAVPRTIYFIFDIADYGFYEEILDGFETVLSPRRFTALLCPVDSDPERRTIQLEELCKRKPGGIIYALRDFHEDILDIIQSAHVPVVLARKYQQVKDKYHSCYVNFSEGSYRMTQHLIAQGHRKIMLLVERVSFQFVASFCEGWQRAYEESGLPCSASWIVHTLNAVQSGYAKAVELLQSDSMPDAFFCASGEMAFGALRAAREYGIPVPDQLAVVGFTNPAIAQLSDPQLTTIDQSIRQLGVIAARLLFDLIEEKIDDRMAPQEIVLHPKLLVRGSCGELKK